MKTREITLPPLPTSEDIMNFGLTAARPLPYYRPTLRARGVATFVPLAGVISSQHNEAKRRYEADKMHLKNKKEYSNEIVELINISYARCELANTLMREAIHAFKDYVGESEWRDHIKRYARDVRDTLSNHDAETFKAFGDKALERYDDICSFYDDEARKYINYIVEQVSAAFEGCPAPLLKAYARMVIANTALTMVDAVITKTAEQHNREHPYMADVIMGFVHPIRLKKDFHHLVEEFKAICRNRERQTGCYDKLLNAEARLVKSSIKRFADFIGRQAPIRRVLKKADREEDKRNANAQ